MTEQKIHRFNPETGKPNPVSYKEFALMDRKDSKAFMKALSKREQIDFATALNVAYVSMPKSEKIELKKQQIAKLEKQEHQTLGDKMDLALVKFQLGQLMLPEKKPIFFRKLRSKEATLPKWLAQKKSPYLIGA